MQEIHEQCKGSFETTPERLPRCHNVDPQGVVEVQEIVLDVCYDFARRLMPNIRIEHTWCSPAKEELNIWIQQFASWRSRYVVTGIAGIHFDAVVHSLRDIYHDRMYHRNSSTDILSEFVGHVESFAEAAGAPEKTVSSINHMRRILMDVAKLDNERQLLCSRMESALPQLIISLSNTECREQRHRQIGRASCRERV